MSREYTIIITKREPRTQEEKDEYYRDLGRYGHQQINSSHRYKEIDVLTTVLTEDEFYEARNLLVQSWCKKDCD